RLQEGSPFLGLAASVRWGGCKTKVVAAGWRATCFRRAALGRCLWLPAAPSRSALRSGAVRFARGRSGPLVVGPRRAHFWGFAQTSNPGGRFKWVNKGTYEIFRFAPKTIPFYQTVAFRQDDDP